MQITYKRNIYIPQELSSKNQHHQLALQAIFRSQPATLAQKQILQWNHHPWYAQTEGFAKHLQPNAAKLVQLSELLKEDVLQELSGNSS